MAVSKETRAIVMRAIATLADEAVNGTGIDKPLWRRLLIAHMDKQEPEAAKELAAAVLEPWYAERIEDYIRGSRDAGIENLTELEQVKRRLRKLQTIVQIKGQNGQYVAKKIQACTPIEHDTLAEQYEKSGAADLRRAKFHRFVAQQMRLAGLAENDPLSKLLSA